MKQQSRHFAALLCTTLLIAGCSTEDRELTLGYSTEVPADAIAATIKTYLNEHGFSIVLDGDQAAMPLEIIEAVRTGSLDMAVVEESKVPTPHIVTIAPLYPSVLHVLHNRPDDPQDIVELLRNASVYAGPVGGAAQRLLQQLAGDSGLTSSEFSVLDNPWTEDPDVYFIIGGLLPPDSVRQLAGYRFFSFAAVEQLGTGSVVDGIVLKHHHLKPFVLPQDIYYSLNSEPVVTLSTRSVLIANASLDDEIAYEVAALLFNNAQDIALDYPLVTQELRTDTNVGELMFPLHSGSRRFLEKDKPGFLERYVDILALIFTIVITLLSAAFAWYRHRKQIRKDRVDVYYCKLLEIRKDMEQPGPAADYPLFRKRTLEVQQEVLSLLVDERVAADSSLIAFFSLSGQMINELDRRIGYAT